MKKLNQNSKEAGVNAQQYKHKHHEIIVKAIVFLNHVNSKKQNNSGYTAEDISRVTVWIVGDKRRISYHQVYRRLKEMIKADLIEISANVGISPSGKPCSSYRLKSKKK